MAGETAGGLRLVHTMEPVITDCIEKLRWFCEHDAYHGYDACACPGGNCANRELLTAINRMYARSQLKAWEPILGEPLPGIEALPADADLIECSDEQYTHWRESLRVCCRYITQRKHITDMAATKMLHLLRPRFVAISDSYLRDVLGVRTLVWQGESRRGEYYAERAVRVGDAVRLIGKVNEPLLADLQRQMAADRLPMSKARIVDILIWSDVAIPTNPTWKEQATEMGWTSVAHQR